MSMCLVIMLTVPLETQFPEFAKNCKNRLRSWGSIFIMSASTKDMWTKASAVLKNLVRNRLSTRTWLHLNCLLYRWKHSLRNSQKIWKKQSSFQKINLYYLGVKERYLNQSFSDVKGRHPESFQQKNDLIAFELLTLQLETQFAESTKNCKNSLLSRRWIFIISASTKDMWTKVLAMLKNVVWNRFSTRTTWLHLNCWLYHWKHSLHITQKNWKKVFVPEDQSLLSRPQWTIFEPKFQRC